MQRVRVKRTMSLVGQIKTSFLADKDKVGTFVSRYQAYVYTTVCYDKTPPRGVQVIKII